MEVAIISGIALIAANKLMNPSSEEINKQVNDGINKQINNKVNNRVNNKASNQIEYDFTPQKEGYQQLSEIGVPQAANVVDDAVFLSENKLLHTYMTPQFKKDPHFARSGEYTERFELWTGKVKPMYDRPEKKENPPMYAPFKEGYLPNHNQIMNDVNNMQGRFRDTTGQTAKAFEKPTEPIKVPHGLGMGYNAEPTDRPFHELYRPNEYTSDQLTGKVRPTYELERTNPGMKFDSQNIYIQGDYTRKTNQAVYGQNTSEFIPTLGAFIAPVKPSEELVRRNPKMPENQIVYMGAPYGSEIYPGMPELLNSVMPDPKVKATHTNNQVERNIVRPIEGNFADPTEGLEAFESRRYNYITDQIQYMDTPDGIIEKGPINVATKIYANTQDKREQQRTTGNYMGMPDTLADQANQNELIDPDSYAIRDPRKINDYLIDMREKAPDTLAGSRQAIRNKQLFKQRQQYDFVENNHQGYITKPVQESSHTIQNVEVKPTKKEIQSRPYVGGGCLAIGNHQHDDKYLAQMRKNEKRNAVDNRRRENFGQKPQEMIRGDNGDGIYWNYPRKTLRMAKDPGPNPVNFTPISYINDAPAQTQSRNINDNTRTYWRLENFIAPKMKFKKSNFEN